MTAEIKKRIRSILHEMPKNIRENLVGVCGATSISDKFRYKIYDAESKTLADDLIGTEETAKSINSEIKSQRNGVNDFLQIARDHYLCMPHGERYVFSIVLH